MAINAIINAICADAEGDILASVRTHRRADLAEAFEEAIRDIVSDQAEITLEDTTQLVECWGSMVEEGSQFPTLDDQTINADLNGEALLGFFATDERTITGRVQNGNNSVRFAARVRKVRRNRRVLSVKIEVREDS